MSNYNCLTMMILRKCRANYEELTSLINMGHRVGKAEGRLPADQTGKLDPQSRIDREIGNLTQIRYTIDLTREYHNLLEKTEGEKR